MPIQEYTKEAAHSLLREFEQAKAAGLTPDNINRLSTQVRELQEKIALSGRGPVAADGHDLSQHIRSDGTVALTRSVENVTFGGRTIAREVPGLLDSAPADEWHKDFRQAAADRSLARLFLVSPKRGQQPSTPILDAKLLSLAASAPRSIRGAVEKAISDTAGSGAEWIPDMPMDVLYEDFYLPSQVESLFGVVNVAGSIIVPKISDVTRPYIGGIQSTNIPVAITPSNPATSNSTIDPKSLAVRMLLDAQAVEDSIIPLIPEMQRRLARAIADGVEDAIINGDTAAPHQDAIASWNIRSRWGTDGLGGSADHRRLWIGLRALAYDRTATVDQSAGQTVAKIMEELVGLLGERGNVGATIITSPEVFFKKILTDTNLLTVDKAGLMATVLTGQVSMVGGMRIVLSRYVSADLAATGLYTGTGAYSGVLAVSPDDFKVYNRRGTLVEMEKEIESQVHNLVATRRLTFQTLSASSVKPAAFGFKWL
jgi:hypothetical protein